MWFINNQEIDLKELLDWMGRVNETVVAKHSARLGLVRVEGGKLTVAVQCHTPSGHRYQAPVSRRCRD